MFHTSTLKAGAMALALGVAGTGAFAQAAQYSDEKLEAFVTAAIEVSAMNAEAQQAIQSADTQEEKQELAMSAQAEAEAFIEQAENITVEEYTTIGGQLQSDEDLANRVTALVQEQTQPQQ